MNKIFCFLVPQKDFSVLEIWFWSNFFIAWSRIQGVPSTIHLICRMSQACPSQGKLLDSTSEQINLLIGRFPFLFLARKQRCLIRGFLLFFQGKRTREDVRLRFGCHWEQGRLKTHCWILQKGVVRFEVQKVMKDLVTLVEYT